MGATLDDSPFAWRERKDGSVEVTHLGRLVMTVAGAEANKLRAKLAASSAEEAQLALAKITGNFKRGPRRGCM